MPKAKRSAKNAAMRAKSGERYRARDRERYAGLARDEKNERNAEARDRHHKRVARRKSDGSYSPPRICPEWRSRYAERRKELARQRRAADPEKYRRARAAWVDANKEKVLAAARARYKRNIVHARMSAALRRALAGFKKSRPWPVLVGYDAADLKAHLERQFLPGMGWHNIDRWHIDHIVPKKAFSDIPEDFAACWALTNLRPLWATDNMKKSSRRLHLL